MHLLNRPAFWALDVDGAHSLAETRALVRVPRVSTRPAYDQRLTNFDLVTNRVAADFFAAQLDMVNTANLEFFGGSSHGFFIFIVRQAQRPTLSLTTPARGWREVLLAFFL